MAEWSKGNEKSVFMFGGLHFKPCRKITKSERYHFGVDNLSSIFNDDRFPQMKNMKPDMEVGLSKYSWKKADYSRDSFYTASHDSKCDLFRCLENGKLYYPGETQLFQYTEFLVFLTPKNKTAQNKPTLQAKLDAAKETAREAGAHNIVRAGKPKKRGGMEVG